MTEIPRTVADVNILSPATARRLVGPDRIGLGVVEFGMKQKKTRG
jgi:hypothetical protein